MSLRPQIGKFGADRALTGTSGREVLSISQLNESAKAALEQGIGLVWVEGELSNIARPASGHIYFSLKDSAAQIRCAMFRSRAERVTFKAENGLSVFAQGRVSLYTARGDYQLIVDSLEPAGDGLLRLRFEQLKRRLFEQGLFEQARKRNLPSWPRQIGVVTSPSGAAVRDIVTVLRRRCPSIPVIIYPTAVQGEAAAQEIVAAIAIANRRAECDVLIVGRGGGSLEDLWPFNEERVARAIFDSAIPIVSAVGHEIDFTIADLVADLRAATPSAAAELVSPDATTMTRRIAALEQRLRINSKYAMAARTQQLQQLRARLISPQKRLEANYQRLDELSQRLTQAAMTEMKLRRNHLQILTTRVAARSPVALMALVRRDLTYASARLHQAMRQQLDRHSQALAKFEGVLRAMGPIATLERGYAIVTDKHGNVLRNASDIAVGVAVDTRLAHGSFSSTVSATSTKVEPS